MMSSFSNKYLENSFFFRKQKKPLSSMRMAFAIIYIELKKEDFYHPRIS